MDLGGVSGVRGRGREPPIRPDVAVSQAWAMLPPCPTPHRPPSLPGGRAAAKSGRPRVSSQRMALKWPFVVKLGFGKGKAVEKFTGRRRKRQKGGRPDRPDPSQDEERKSPRTLPLEAPAFGHLRESFGSFRQFQLGCSTPSSLSPTRTPLAFSGQWQLCTWPRVRVPPIAASIY